MSDKDRYITGDFIVHLFDNTGKLITLAPVGTYIEARIRVNKHLASGKNLAGAVSKVLYNDIN